MIIENNSKGKCSKCGSPIGIFTQWLYDIPIGIVVCQNENCENYIVTLDKRSHKEIIKEWEEKYKKAERTINEIEKFCDIYTNDKAEEAVDPAYRINKLLFKHIKRLITEYK